MTSFLSYLAVISLGLLSVYFLTQKKPKRTDGLKELPSPNIIKLPIFGHMLWLGSQPFTKLMKWHREIGPIFKLEIGNQVWVMVDDPNVAHEVFVKSGQTTSSRPNHRFIENIYSKNRKGILFSKYGQTWKNNRAYTLSLLKPASAEKFYHFLPLEIEKLMDRLTKLSLKGEAFDPAPEFQLAALNVLLSVLFGKRLSNTLDPGYKLLQTVLEQLNLFSGVAGDLNGFIPSLSWIELFTGATKKQEFQSKKIDEARKWLMQEARDSEGEPFIKELIRLKDEEKLITEEDIEVLITDFVVASTATSADTPQWAFTIIAQAPHIQEKIIQELDDWKKKNPTREVPNFFDDREEFPYMISVQKEILRFRPPGPGGVSHAASDDTVIDGYLIPKDAAIVASILSMHFNPNVYENPDVFRPERFMNNTEKMSTLANGRVKDRDIFSFGWGRRICPGIYVSEMETFEFFVHFFSRFTVHPSPEAQKHGLGLGPKDFLEIGTLIRPIDPNVIIKLRK